MYFYNNNFKFLILVLPFLHLKVFSQEKEQKEKTTKGYFGKSTNFYDKDGNPKLLNKDFKLLTYEELEHNRNIHKSKKAKDVVTRYTERMISVCKDSDKIRTLRLELADLYFETGRHDKAAAAYDEYKKLYPGNKDLIEDISFKAILSKSKLNLPSDKDQNQTNETLNSIKEFIKNGYNKHNKGIKEIANECNKKLLGSELNVFNHYLNKPNLKAAELRLKYIKENFFKNPESDQFILNECEKQLTAAKENKVYSPKYTVTTNSTIFENNVKVSKDGSGNKKGRKSYASRF